jgi:hypothetical protein
VLGVVHDELVGDIEGYVHESHAKGTADVQKVIRALARVVHSLARVRQEEEPVRIQGQHDVAVR